MPSTHYTLQRDIDKSGLLIRKAATSDRAQISIHVASRIHGTDKKCIAIYEGPAIDLVSGQITDWVASEGNHLPHSALDHHWGIAVAMVVEHLTRQAMLLAELPPVSYK